MRIQSAAIRRPLSLAIALITTANVVPAQSAVLEEVVVTAQKREQNLQDVGVSVSAFTGDQTRALGWNSSEDLAAQTPGLIATSFSGDSSVSLFSLRGVGQNDFADHQEAPSAMYVDGVYIASTGAAGFQMFDLDRVEVLRGPQGTLFGRNATGGLVHIINNKPTEEFEAYMDVTLADYNQRRFEGAISGRLTDNLLGRFSFLTDNADGYFKNTNGADVRDRDLSSWRGQLEYRPSEDVSINFAAWGNEVDKNKAGAYDFRVSHATLGDAATDYQGTPDDSPKPNEGAQNPLGEIDKDSRGYTATITVDTDAFTITSITDYQQLEKYYLEDSDGNMSRSLEYYSNQDSSQFSQEIRLNGQTDRMKWVAGMYYLNIDGDYDSQIAMPTFGGATNNEFTLETKSWSVFGQVEYDLTDDLMLTAGLRWVDDKKEFNINSYCTPVETLPAGGFFNGDPAFGPNDCSWFSSFDPSSPVIVELGEEVKLDRHDEDVSGKFQLDYRLSSDALLYAGVSRGMKGGGYTAPLDGFLPVEELSFEPEVLLSYEAGVKSIWMDGRARLNASVFYYDYSDYQGFVFQGLTSVVRNHDATISGAEVEFYVSPAEGWDVSLGVSVLDATVEDVEVAPGLIKDQDMITAPDLTANMLVRKSWQFAEGDFALQIDGQYVGEQQYNTTNSVLTQGDSYSIWNARASYTRDHGENSWEISAFAKNFGDEEYMTYAFDLADFFGYTLQVYGPPRWVGAQVQYRWK